MTDVPLKIKAANTLPSFVCDDYKTFAAFLDAYHEWLDLNQADIKTIVDVDTTLEEFIRHFQSEVDYKNLKFPHVDERFLIRHLKNLYLSKGTEESYRTLFKMLFNKDVIIKYPEKMTLKPSDGKWVQVTSIFVEVTSGSASSIQNKIVKVTNPTTNKNISLEVEQVKLRRTGGAVSTISLLLGGTGYTNPTITFSGGHGSGAAAHAVVTGGVITSIVVDNPGSGYTSPPIVTITGTNTTPASINTVYLFVSPDVYECNVNRNYYGTIDIGDTVSLGDFSGRVMPTINSFVIKNAGSNFRLGQTFSIDTTFGRGALVKVSRLTATKGIAELKFIRYGYGYLSDFTSNSLIPPNVSQSLPSDGFVGQNGVFHEYAYSEPNGGYILNETYTKTPSDTLYANDYAGAIAREFYSDNKYRGDPANGAVVDFKLGAVCKYPGYYVNSDGMSSDETKIQDSFLYQKYSYVVQVDEKLDTYRDVVKSILHPAGMALFGEYNIRNHFDVKIKLNALFSLFSVKHADSAALNDSNVFVKGHVVNDDTAAIYGTERDWTNTYDTLTKYVLGKIVDDPNDFAEAGSENTVPTDVNTFVFEQNSTFDATDLTAVPEEYVKSIAKKLKSQIQNSTDSVSIQLSGDGIRLVGDAVWGNDRDFNNDINNNIVTFIVNSSMVMGDDSTQTDSGGVMKNQYDTGSYVIESYATNYDSTF